MEESEFATAAGVTWEIAASAGSHLENVGQAVPARKE
jgi:hypothetical protein